MITKIAVKELEKKPKSALDKYKKWFYSQPKLYQVMQTGAGAGLGVYLGSKLGDKINSMKS